MVKGRIDWRKIANRSYRRFKRGWKIYKGSTVGKIGLYIMIGFFVVAIGAPLLAPYPPDFIAPSVDIFKGDRFVELLPSSSKINLTDPLLEDWHAPVGYQGEKEYLDTLLVYSSKGHAIQYDVERVAKEAVGEAQMVGVALQEPEFYQVPENIAFIYPMFFRNRFYLTVAGEWIYELKYDDPSYVNRSLETNIGFSPVYFSNVWNRWSLANNQGLFFFAAANEEKLVLYAKRPPNQIIGEWQAHTYTSLINITENDRTEGQHIIGDPLVIQRNDLPNGSLIVVPLDRSLVAFELNITKKGSSITDIRLGDIIWQTVYAHVHLEEDRKLEPIHGRPISLSKNDPSEDMGKERILFASKDGHLYSFMRENGKLEWTTVITNRDVVDPVFTGIYPTYRGDLLVVGVTQGRGFIASLDPSNGVVAENGSALFFTKGRIISTPVYVPSPRMYLFNTDQSIIYLLKETMELSASFTVIGDVATPAQFVGNIINTVGSFQGNYYGIITKDGKVYVESITGVNIAPLPPGQYPSGNWYFLGTDVFGGDILTQVIYGTQIELVVGLVSAGIAVGVGTLIGLLAGFYGGWIDTLLMRIADIFLTLPILVIILLIAALMGTEIFYIILIIAIFSWAGLSRVIRAQTMSIKNRSFIDAARVSGATNRKIILRHLTPNVLPFSFLYMTFIISGAIITEAILAFLGFSDPKVMTWGMMLQYLRISGNTLRAPWWLFPPGIAITLLSLSFYLIGRALDEVVNPRLRAR